MKKLRYIISFLNKKGVFALGLVFGIVLALFFSNFVFAEASTSSYVLIDADCIYSKNGTDITKSYGFKISVSDPDYLTKYAGVLNTGSIVAGITCNKVGVISLNSTTFEVERDGNVTTVTGTNYSTDTSVLSYTSNIYIFSTSQMAELYLNGEIDASSALNYEEVQNANRSFSYDSDLPYYDKTSLSLNADNTCLLDANMSNSQRDLYNSFSTDSGSPFMIELYSHAIYAKTTDLGNFNAFVLMYGTENNLGNKLPNAKKVDEIIKFDSSGRLIVNGEQGFTGGGGRHGDSFSISDSSPLIAYTFEQVTFRDGLSATSHFTRDVSYVGTEMDGYILIGYMTEICLVYPDGNDVRYGRKTYSYTWLTRALRERYGSQSSFYDGDGVKFEGEDYVFDEYGKEVDSTYSGGNLNNDNVIDYIKNGYGLSGTDGYIEMSRRFFVGIPDYIWGIIAFALSINVIVILFKVLRGM